MVKLILFIFSSYLFLANVNKDLILATVGNEKISFSDLEKAYNKNLKSNERKFSELSKKEAEDFIKLYTNYRLKVLDAIDKGYLNDSAVIDEITTNQKLLAESYYLEKELVDKKVSQLVGRRMEELKIAFIIVPLRAEGLDSNETYNPDKITKEALDRILEGESFESIAKIYSKDAKTASDGGIVDTWITGGKIQKPVEDVLYSLSAGQFHKEIIKTSYGNFLVKLIEKEKRYKIKSSHILVNFWGDGTISETEAEILADSLYNLIKNSADFEELAREFSKDDQSAKNGGHLPNWFSRSTGFDKTAATLLPEIQNQLYKMKPGEVSKPIATQYGLHILRLDSIKDIDKIKEAEEVKKIYKQRQYAIDKIDFMDSVAKHYNFELKASTVDQVVNLVDSNQTTLGNKWVEQIESIKDEILFSFNKKEYSLMEVVNLVEANRKLRGFSIDKNGISQLTKAIIEGEIYKLGSNELEKKYTEFADLLNEFRDGIILFKAENEEVWSKREYDDKIGKSYWDSTKSNYKTRFRFNIDEIYILNKEKAEELTSELTIDNFSEMASLKTQREGFREKNGNHGWVEAGKDKIANIIPLSDIGKNKIIGPLKSGIGWSLIKINEFQSPREMTYEEAKPYMSQAVQNIVQEQLREEWLERIEAKHKVIIKEKNLNEIFN